MEVLGGRSRAWRPACLASAWVPFFLCGFESIAEGTRGFYSWEMESACESGQQQKRKLVPHGLEDQKRVSGRTSLVAWLMALALLSVVQRAQVASSVLLTMLVCLSLVREAGRWLVICQVPELGVKP